MKNWYVIGVLLLVLVLSSCGSDNVNSEKEEVVVDTPLTQEQKQVVANGGGEVIEEAVTETEIIVKEFEMDSFTEIVDGKYFPQFSVKEIEVNEWDPVRLKIRTTKGTHDIKIDEFNVFAETPVDEVTIVEFVADKKGTFQYYCSKPNHRENGHWRTIVVK